MAILLGLALTGCVGNGGYEDTARIALPPGAALAQDMQAVPRYGEVDVVARRGPLVGAESSPPAVVPVSALPPEIAQEHGPRGTSGEAHEDGVGYAILMADPPEARWSNVVIGVAYPGQPAGSLVEVTALDTGRNIVALVVGQETRGALVALSPGAAQALGVGDRAGVRVRSVVANPQDEMALRSGRAASQRLDAPPALLTALRRKLPGERSAPVANLQNRTPTAPRMAPPKRTIPAPAAARGGYIVQVAALSSAVRAATLARDLGGRVSVIGGLYRVQLGPFGDAASAARARDGVARHGYGDARILRNE